MTADAGLTWDTPMGIANRRNGFVSRVRVYRNWLACDDHCRAWHGGSLAKGLLHPTWQTVQDHDSAFFDAMHWLDDTTGIIFGDAVGDCLTMFQTMPVNPGRVAMQRTSDKHHGRIRASNGNIASAGDTIWVVTGGSFEGVALA